MSDDNDRRSLARRGKPLVYGEIIISEPIYVQQLAAARGEGRAAGYAEAIERIVEEFDGFCHAHGINLVERIRTFKPAASPEPK